MAITISQEKSGFQPSLRIIEELKLLEKVAKNVIVGSKTVGDIRYTAVLVKGIRVSSSNLV